MPKKADTASSASEWWSPRLMVYERSPHPQYTVWPPSKSPARPPSYSPPPTFYDAQPYRAYLTGLPRAQRGLPASDRESSSSTSASADDSVETKESPFPDGSGGGYDLDRSSSSSYDSSRLKRKRSSSTKSRSTDKRVREWLSTSRPDREPGRTVDSAGRRRQRRERLGAWTATMGRAGMKREDGSSY